MSMTEVKRVSLSQQVVKSLMAYISDGTKKVGDKIPTEQTLCEMMGIGRSTLREAIHVLIANGYIEIRPGHGTYIKSIDMSENERLANWFRTNEIPIIDILTVRNVVDPLTAKLAAQKSVQADIDALNQIVALTQQAIDAGDLMEIARLDEQFHTYIAQCSKNELLVAINRVIAKSLADFRCNTFRVKSNVDNLIKPHQIIVEAIRRHDEQGSEQAMMHHLDCVRHDLGKSKELDHPEDEAKESAQKAFS